MANDDRTKIIAGRTPESAAMLANVKHAMAITTSPLPGSGPPHLESTEIVVRISIVNNVTERRFSCRAGGGCRPLGETAA